MDNLTKIGILILLLAIIRCTPKQPSTSSSHKEEVKSANTQAIENKKERYPDARDSVLRNYVDHRKPHPDSIKKWNAQVLEEKKKYTIKPDSDTKFFTINPETGEVSGCPLIKFKGVLDDVYWNDQKNKRDSLRAKFAAIRPKLRAVIMKGKENELWYGDPKNVEIEGTPEAVHSGRGPVGFLYSDDNIKLVIPVGYPHGGMMDEIFFFDIDGNFLSKTVLDRPLNMPTVDFNDEQTFVIVSDGVRGDFYFFKFNGELFKKGNFNELTGDRGTSYGKPIISKSGKYWVLNNNLRWFFNKKGVNVLKSNLSVIDLDENLNVALCYEFSNIFTKEGRLFILNIEKNIISYSSNILYTKNYRYEIK